MQVMAVWTHKDPAINGFTILKDRSKMTAPLNMADMHANFFFGFYNSVLTPVLLDPEIGTFTIFQTSLTIDSTG